MTDKRILTGDADFNGIYDTLKWAGGATLTLILGVAGWGFARIGSLEGEMRDSIDDLRKQLLAQSTRAADFREAIAGRMVTKDDLNAMEARISGALQRGFRPKRAEDTLPQGDD
jgi:hypothetical protein